MANVSFLQPLPQDPSQLGQLNRLKEQLLSSYTAARGRSKAFRVGNPTGWISRVAYVVGSHLIGCSSWVASIVGVAFLGEMIS